jgi:hypothetical protein
MTEMVWVNFHPQHRLADLVGYIPSMLDADDPRPAKEQLHSQYAHGGGWHPFKGFTLNREEMTLEYPEDPPTRAYAMTRLPKTNEVVMVFEHAWVAIIQDNGDGEYEIARMD